MRFYKFQKWQQCFYPNAIFDFHKQPVENKVIYLTFDDGPTPGVTNLILDSLDEQNAKATFFCIGEKVKKHPQLFQEIINRGHSVGNHTMTHINGFKTSTKIYVDNVLEAKTYINSNLFRPPYGKCTLKQHKKISSLGFKTVFWSHLSYDFDSSLITEERIQKLKNQSKNGSVIVFHDTEEAFKKKEFEIMLEYYEANNFKLVAIT